MKYFTKYLPVEGEIKEGDYYITAPDYINIRKCEDKSWGTFEMCKKVKLFLCSRDIQVGDIILHDNNLEARLTATKSTIELIRQRQDPSWVNPQPSFKVIGEVSPETLEWVTEGMEFEEDQVLCRYKHRSFPDMDFTSNHSMQKEDWDEKEEEKYACVVEIKCPTCKYFH